MARPSRVRSGGFARWSMTMRRRGCRAERIGMSSRCRGRTATTSSGDTALLEHGEGLVHLGPQEPVRIRLVVDEVAHPHHQRVARPLVECRRRRRRVIERREPDDPDDLGVRGGGCPHQRGVLGVVGGLHLDGEVDARRSQLGREVVERHGAVDRGELRARASRTRPGRGPRRADARRSRERAFRLRLFGVWSVSQHAVAVPHGAQRFAARAARRARSTRAPPALARAGARPPRGREARRRRRRRRR